jgi:hypothetical protein
LKLGYYLDDRNTTRRLMWTLAHTHGTLFSMVHVGFALSVGYLASAGRRGLLLASRCLIGGLILMPLGFFLGGLWLYGGDPGPGVFLVPAGGLFMLVAVTAIVIMARGKRLVTETPGAERTRRHRPRRG